MAAVPWMVIDEDDEVWLRLPWRCALFMVYTCDDIDPADKVLRLRDIRRKFGIKGAYRQDGKRLL